MNDFAEKYDMETAAAWVLGHAKHIGIPVLPACGFSQLHAEQKDICQQPFPENSFDVVNMLEVMEHILDVEKAIAAAVKMVKQYVVVSVPSKPDNNPEHIHLRTREKLTRMFGAAGCTRLHFDGTRGHLFMVVAVEI